jgi:CRP-like cAMP-binding protein
MNGDAGDGDDRIAYRARSVLAPHLRRRTFRAGDLLWREGDDEGLFVSIESGRVKAYRTLPGGSEVTLYLFGPSDAFGFTPFLDGRPYPASARALTDVEAMTMSRSEFAAALASDPSVAPAVFGLVAARLRDALDRVERASTPNVLPRAAAALASLLPASGASGLAVVELPVRSSEFAAALGVTPESFSRAVTRLVEAGVLHRLGPRRFQILDAVGLRRAASAGSARAGQLAGEQVPPAPAPAGAKTRPSRPRAGARSKTRR